MTRYIDADNEKLRYELSTFTRDTLIDEAPFENALTALDNAPTVDAIEVVRCGECRLHGTYRCPMLDEDVWDGGITKDYMWCYFGERKGGDTE